MMAENLSADALVGIDQFMDQILSKFADYANNQEIGSSALINHLIMLQQELIKDAEPGAELNPATVLLFEKAVNRIREFMERTGLEHREIHAGLSKCGRLIDRNFEYNIGGLCSKEMQQHEFVPETRDLVNKLTVQHFLSAGQFDVAETFAQESNIDLDEAKKDLFAELYTIMDALNQRELDPALEWAKQHRSQLQALDSRLEFTLHKMKFIQLLWGGVKDQLTAVAYSRNFEPFGEKHADDIQSLMICLMFLPDGLEKSPYRHVLDPALWDELVEMFAKDSRAVKGIPVNSALSVLLNSGTMAVPRLLRMQRFMQQRDIFAVCGQNDELPIEIHLGEDNQFHSIFTCPILRKQTVESNPPMRLRCGHVISKEAVRQLAINNKLKCPMCPVQSMAAEAQEICF